MDKTFDGVLWEAWKAAHRYYCEGKDQCEEELLRLDFEEWRASLSGLDLETSDA